MASVRGTAGYVAVVLATVCAATSLLALAGGLDPALDLLSHATPFVLLGSALAALLAWPAPLGLRRIGLTLAAVGVAASGALIAPEFLRSVGPRLPLGAPGEIKVVQFNLWRDNRQLGQVAAWLQRENPDFVVVEEATPALRNLMVSKMGWRVAGAGTTAMIFSRSSYLGMRRPYLGRSARLTWVNATYASASGPLEIVATHLSWPTGPDQTIQRADLGRVIAALPRDRMILAGDFNSTSWSFARRADDANWGLIRRDRALATWPAGRVGPWPWPAPFPFLPIDHIYAGPGWAITGVARGPRLGSDHYPIVMTLAPVRPGR